MNPDPDGVTVREVRIPLPDGTGTLAADLYRAPGSGPAPVIVSAMPYRKDFIGGLGYDAAFRYFAERGYPGLLIDLRGRGGSDGPPSPRLDPQDGHDVVAAIEWAAEQSWCDGTAGMWGISYGAATTLRVASLRPERLKAIIPVVGKPDPERYDGARGDFGLMTGWGAQQLLLQLMPPFTDDPADEARWRARLDAVPVLKDLDRHGRRDPEWRRRRIDVGSIVTPALCIGGWQDMFPDAVIDTFASLGGPKQLLMGPWLHSLPNESPYGTLDFAALATAWWDRWLRNAEGAPVPEAAVTVFTPDGWRGYDSWPPAAEPVHWSTADDAMLVAGETAGPPATVIGEYLPDARVGTRLGLGGESVAAGLPLDQHDDDMRSVLVESLPLDRDLEVRGAAEVVVAIAPESPPVQRLIVRLESVDGAGRSSLISWGRLTPQQTVPDRADREYIVRLRPTIARVAAGCRLRIAVCDGEFPRMTPLPSPTPILLAQVRLAIPVGGEGHNGRSVSLPELPAADVTPEEWGIEELPEQEAVRFHIRTRRTGRTPAGHEFRRAGDLTASVARAAPAGAAFRGVYEVGITTVSGREQLARVEVDAVGGAIRAIGEVLIDGRVAFSGEWTLPV